MDMHLYFNLAKLVYSLSTRRDKFFVVYEIGGSIIVIILAFFFYDGLLSYLQRVSVPWTSPVGSKLLLLLNSSIFGLLFILSSFLSRQLVPKYPIEVPDAPKNKKIITIGIIDFSWLIIIGATYVCALFCRTFPVFIESIEKNKKEIYYNLYYSELSALFDRSVNMMLILGTILAGCMTIIWAGEIWRKKDPRSRNEYNSTAMASIKMVIAYFIIIFAVIAWVSLPLYEKMSSIKTFL